MCAFYEKINNAREVYIKNLGIYHTLLGTWCVHQITKYTLFFNSLLFRASHSSQTSIDRLAKR